MINLSKTETIRQISIITNLSTTDIYHRKPVTAYYISNLNLFYKDPLKFQLTIKMTPKSHYLIHFLQNHYLNTPLSIKNPHIKIY